MPDGATDCHFHIYDARQPVAAETVLRHGDASVEDYRALQRRLGTTRGVLVQPSTYGTDNRLHLAALQDFGTERFRMVAVVEPDVADAELRRLHAAGVRGVRFNLTQPGPLALGDLEPMARRLAELGWHCQLNMRPDQVVAAERMLLRLPCRIVFDHLGRIRDPEAADADAFAAIRRLLDHGKAWMKLSGIYITAVRDRRGMRMRVRSRWHSRPPHRSGCCGGATGRTRPNPRIGSPTMPGSSTCWPNGCRTRMPGAACSWTTRRRSTASRLADEGSSAARTRSKAGRQIRIGDDRSNATR